MRRCDVQTRHLRASKRVKIEPGFSLVLRHFSSSFICASLIVTHSIRHVSTWMLNRCHALCCQTIFAKSSFCPRPARRSDSSLYCIIAHPTIHPTPSIIHIAAPADPRPSFITPLSLVLDLCYTLPHPSIHPYPYPISHIPTSNSPFVHTPLFPSCPLCAARLTPQA